MEQRRFLLQEALAIAKGRTDKVFFAKYFLGLEINLFQERYLRREGLQNLVITGNQAGKTVAIAILHLHYNFYKIGISGNPEIVEQSSYETLNISPVSRQSKEAFRYIDEILHNSFTWQRERERLVNKCKIEWFFKRSDRTEGRTDFSNNSSCFCLSTGADMASGFQGKQFGLITYDEAPQSLHMREELPARIFSRASKYNARIDLVATPDEAARSQQYWFHLYSEAEKGIGDWKLTTGTYDENIFIPEYKRERYKKRLKKISKEHYQQVIYGKFISSETIMFPHNMIEVLWSREGAREKPDSNRKYVLCIDWGVADAGDETVMLIADWTDLSDISVEYAYCKKGGDPVELVAMATFLQQTWNGADTIMDTASLGGEIFRKMLSSLKPIRFGKELKKDALFFLKARMSSNLKQKGSKFKSYYLPKLEEQLASYKIEDKKLRQDWVMVFAQLAWFVEKHLKRVGVKSFKLKSYSYGESAQR